MTVKARTGFAKQLKVTGPSGILGLGQRRIKDGHNAHV